MALATFKEILGDAQKRKFAIGSFNAWDQLSVKTLIDTAERLASPVIIALWKTELDFFGEEELWWAAVNRAKKAVVPVAIFVDHAQTLAEIERAIELGATSVMIDGSHHSLEDNIRLTKAATEMAHKAGISIEGELGMLGEEAGSDPDEKFYTCVDDAALFVKETGIDALAVAIGNAHGFYKIEPKLDFDRLAAIKEQVAVPLVLHGGTGIPDSDVTRAIGMGIAKVNIGADGRHAFFQGVRRSLEEMPKERFPHMIYKQAVASHAELIENKMCNFMSVEKANKG